MHFTKKSLNKNIFSKTCVCLVFCSARVQTNSNMESVDSLSETQRAVFQTVVASLPRTSETGSAFLVEGAAGTGKTYLLNQIMAHCDDNDIDAIAVGYTGAASCLLVNGRTVHSQFRIPWKRPVCSIDPKHRLYKAIRKAAVLVWDQAENCNKSIFESVDQFLRTMMKSNQIFGGKVVVVCGDFRGCLPIARKTENVPAESHSLLYSEVFNRMQKFVLQENFRFEYQTDYRFCLEIGAGIQNEINVPEQCRVYNVGDLIQTIYHGFHSTSTEDFMKRSILAVHVRDVDYLNNECLKQLCNNQQFYEAFNYFRKIDAEQSSRFLSFEKTMATVPSYFPPNFLFLDVNCPIILTQTYKGLPQGTRLVVKKVTKRSFLAEIGSGDRKGNWLKIFKVRSVLPFARANLEFVRVQFPVALAFSSTINKAQSLQFKQLGLFFPHPAFNHGQMYTAFSRVPFIERDLKVLVVQPNDEDFSYDRLPNIVNTNVAARFLPIP